jgi:hypothetical protein
MLAERFQQDFYDHLAAEAMLAAGGRAPLLVELESEARESAKGDSKSKKEAKPAKAASRADGDHEK